MATLSVDGITYNLQAVKRGIVEVSSTNIMNTDTTAMVYSNVAAGKTVVPTFSIDTTNINITNSGRFGVIDPNSNPQKRNPWSA